MQQRLKQTKPIEIKNRPVAYDGPRSWNDNRHHLSPIRSNCFSLPNLQHNNDLSPRFNNYNAIKNAKGAGIIPYTIHNGKVLFLFQKCTYPVTNKNQGWNDFGGKKDIETDGDSIDVACREFSEETSCLFFIKQSKEYEYLYDEIKYTKDKKYDIYKDIITKLIDISKNHYVNILRNNLCSYPMEISVKDTYITFPLKVDYIDANDIPEMEDAHLDYDVRYLRKCEWIPYEELIKMEPSCFHKRLQILHIIKKIKKFHDDNLLENCDDKILNI